MTAPDSLALAEPLRNGLTLRTPTERDFERIAAFNAAIHGPEVGPTTRSLLNDYPGMQPADQFFVDTAGGEVVSTLCLIPWTWRYEAIELPVGELGIVGTAEPYRGQGLVRAQMAAFKRRLDERGCLLSIIQGIPYFYRQFGYEYALPLEGGYRWELRDMPAAPEPADRVRRASQDDLPALAALYEASMRKLCIATVRSDDVWRYLHTRNDPADAMFHDTWIAESAEHDRPLGYMRIPHYHFDDELAIDEAYATRHETALALLAHAKALAEERNKPGVRLNLPPSSYFVRLAQAHRAHSLGTYAWQIHIPDDAALLRALAPVLEARLHASPFVGWTGTYCISFYTRALSLHFANGVLANVIETPPPEDAGVRMPCAAFTPFVLGHRSLDELRDQYPDAGADRVAKLLAYTLFPKRPSFIHTTY